MFNPTWRKSARKGPTQDGVRAAKSRLAFEVLEGRDVPAVIPTYTVTQDWGTGFQGEIRLQNPDPTPVNNWQLQFDFGASVSSIWDGKIESRTGNHYVVKNAGWNSTITAGGAVSFGFVASGSKAAPTNYVLNGVAIGGPATPQLPTLSVSDVSVVEGNSGTTNAVFTVTLSAASANAVSVRYATANGTAQAGSDYTGQSGTLTFSPGQTSRTISVPVFGDTAVEPDETFTLTLTAPTAATLARSMATGTIRNDDLPPPPPPPPASPPTSPPAAGTVTFQATSDWGSGFTGQVTARNTGTAALTNWTVEFDFAGQITSLWDGNIVSHVGNHYVVTHAGWNSSIPAGGTVTFGFNGTPGNLTAATSPTNFVLKGSGGQATPVTPPPAATVSWPAHVFAPFVDMAMYPLYDLTAVARTEGIKFFNLAFVVAAPGNVPAWGGFGTYSVNGSEWDVAIRNQIAGVRALGGDVTVSFGGANGTELAQGITSVSALKAAYQSVIDAYTLTRIDFDIEGAAQADRASVDRRSQAIAALQQDAAAAGRRLDVWLTLPVLPTGLTADGLYVVQSALRYGVVLSGVNVMAMDYGDSAAPNPQGKMGDYAIQAAEGLFTQLKAQYGAAKTDAQLWQMVGVTPMIGVNDVTTEVFDQQEARELVAFARQKGIGELAMWSLNRDQSNPRGAINYVEPTSSSIVQTPFEFSHILDDIML